MRESGVPQRPEGLRHPHRLPAHLQHERFGNRPQHVGARHAEGGAVQPREVDRRAGERQRRVQRQRQRTPAYGGVEDREPMPAARVGEQLPRPDGARLGQPGHQAWQHVVGDGQQDQRAAGDHLVRRHQRDAREQLGRAGPGLLADGGRRNDIVPGTGEGGTQHGAHATGADDPHHEAGGSGTSCDHETFQSCSGYRTSAE